MTMTERQQDRPQDRSQALALDRCNELIRWYQKYKPRQRNLDNLLRTATLLAAGLTAFAATIDGLPKWAVVLPAVITTLATGMSASFRFHERYVAFASALEKLEWLKLRFQLRALAAPDDAVALDKFVSDMESIALAEFREWRDALSSKGDANSGQQAASGAT